jgi:RNA polymerase sigma-70 factor (ECF subfamily)
MATAATGAAGPRPEILQAAQNGDQDAFAQLIEPHRRELHAHCYRMLASVHDAEDALQDAFLRAWKALPKFDGRMFRAWLYKIATNTCLDALAKRSKRVLPVDYGPASDPLAGPAEPLVETVWIEPYPDENLGLEDGLAGPEARYEQRESVELAFVAALQHLPAQQRAVLITREVLGYSAKETADLMDTTVQSVNSALQRARKAVEDKLPEQSQQANLRTLDDAELKGVVEGYMDAMSSGDIPRVLDMLTDECTWSMPPVASWFGPKSELGDFLKTGPLSGSWRWRHIATSANGQPAIGAYAWHESGAYLPFALDVLTLEGQKIASICSFIVRTIDLPEGAELNDWPEYDFNDRQLKGVFEQFGLPTRLS